MSLSHSSSLPLAPPPWKCKVSAYILTFYNPASAGLPHEIAYDPVEAKDTTFSSEKHAGKYKGGLCMAQILRYSETPVGSYDELAILPGCFAGIGPKGIKMKDMRITGIWVSQDTTLMNGRRNWNIPKHFARFVWSPLDSAGPITKVEVFPSDPAAVRPFFTASVRPVSYTPSFPFNSSWLGYLGFSTHILQPPLPAGEPADIVVKTEGWRRSAPILATKTAKLVWIDMKQREGGKGGARGEGEGEGEGDALLDKGANENWWPGMRRWNVGLYCPDSVLELGEPEMVIS